MDIKSPNFYFLAKLDFAVMQQTALVERPNIKPKGLNFRPAQTNIERHQKLVYRK
jgi:hypothetical protein